MIKGVIFDVDGTLLNSMGIWETAGLRYLKQYGIEAPADLGSILFAMTFEEAARYLKGEYHLQEEIGQIMEGIRETVKDYYEREAPLKSGARSLLQSFRAKGIPMAVATSSEKEHIEAAFTRLGIRQYFQAIYTCTEVGAGKGKPLIFDWAAACLGTSPAETWVFEDALYALRTAKSAGYRTVGVCDASSIQDQEELMSLADIYVKELQEIEACWMEMEM